MAKLSKIIVSDLPVMKANCITCPFRIIDGRQRDANQANGVTARTLFKAQQICHSTEGKNRKPTHRCKGSYETNKTIYDRMGMGHLLK